MKRKIAHHILSFSALAFILASCGGGDQYSSTSRGTGWDVTGEDGGYELKTDYDGQQTGPGLVFVEGGTFTMGRVADDPMHDWNNTPNQQHVQSFYMDETEVTNGMYTEMLYWIKRVFPPTDEEFRKIYNGAVPDTLVWRNRLGYNEEMTKNYLRHPAYAKYPVVGVTWIQAVEFANWRTDRVNELQLGEAGYTKGPVTNQKGKTFSTETYLNAPTLTYGGDSTMVRGGKESEKIFEDRQKEMEKDSTISGPSNLYVTREDGILLPAYRLPTEAEWEYAALGLSSLREYNSYRGRKKYPWNGSYTRAGRTSRDGDHLANFKQGDGDYGGIAGWSDDGADITAEVMTYEPNAYGLYDMAGNVNEWVADVYRPIIDDEFNDFNYYRGNVYTKISIDSTGRVKVVSPDSIPYDTLSNGRIIARNLPGEVVTEPITEEDTYLRTNFDASDNRDYRDGDKASSKYFKSNDLTEEQRMYDSPQHRVSADSILGLKREYDKSSSRTTLIDNEVRVIKGGSWRDRAYWLDPAQRRFYPQDMARDDIGFRCAMSRVGAKSNDGKRARD